MPFFAQPNTAGRADRLVGRSGGLSWLCGLVLLALLVALPLAGADEAPPLKEHAIKALYLFNFTKYVEWPGELPARHTTNFIIGLLAPAEIVQDLLEITKGKTVHDRTILIRPLQNEQEAKDCQIVFIATEEQARLARTLEVVKSAAVLVVGEAEDFQLRNGTMIDLVRKDNKVRLGIDLEAAKRARLTISAKLLRVAEKVKEKSDASLR